MKILIAEDDTISRYFLEKTLQQMGHQVTAAKDGGEAWKAFLAGDYPMIISDWMMPEIDGIELCRRIRRQNKSYSYFMMLTARTSKTDFLDAMTAGADDYLTKPLDADEIAVRIRMAERIIALKRSPR